MERIYSCLMLNFNSIKVRLELVSFFLVLSRKLTHFNSIKVRLELAFCAPTLIVALPFQFHKGTIRTCLFIRHYALVLHFNSIKVRLELSGSQASYYNQMAFQFHKGTIRTKHKIYDTYVHKSFQFHKGTIRT